MYETTSKLFHRLRGRESGKALLQQERTEPTCAQLLRDLLEQAGLSIPEWIAAADISSSKLFRDIFFLWRNDFFCDKIRNKKAGQTYAKVKSPSRNPKKISSVKYYFIWWCPLPPFSLNSRMDQKIAFSA